MHLDFRNFAGLPITFINSDVTDVIESKAFKSKMIINDPAC